MASIRHQKLDQKVYTALKRKIINRDIQPGDRIQQDELADELGVSKTPLLAALRTLEAERLVTSIPRRGYYVRAITKEEMIEFYEIREVLESLAARRAASRITDAQARRLRGFFAEFADGIDATDAEKYAAEDRRFHEYVIEISGSEILNGMLATFNFMTITYQRAMLGGLVRPPHETLPEHRKVIEAICGKDAAQAEALMRSHMRESRARLMAERRDDD